MPTIGTAIEADFSILDSVRERVQEIKDTIYPSLKAAINSNADLLKEIQTQKQFYDRGQDSDGISITPSYAAKTIKIKTKKGQPTDRVTLNDTGDYYESIAFSGTDTEMIITATVDYASYLSSRYGTLSNTSGTDILGIQDMEFLEFYNQYIAPELTNNINKIIETGI
jgi:phage gpG-like protein